MVDGFGIRPHVVNEASHIMGRAGEDFAAALERLRSRLAAAGSPWGPDSDEISMALAPAYREVNDLALEALGSLGEVIANTSASLARMAETTQATDGARAAELRRLAEGV